MKIKPDETVRTFTVEQKWTIAHEDLEQIICKHLGIPYDNSTYIEISDYSNTLVRRVEIDRQTA